MAIIYTPTISELGNGNYSVNVEITNDVTLKTKTIVILSTRFDTEKQKTDCWDSIRAAYLIEADKPDNPMAAIELEAKTYLEAK